MYEMGPPVDSDSYTERERVKKFLNSVGDNPNTRPPDGWSLWKSQELDRRDSDIAKGKPLSIKKWYRLKCTSGSYKGREVATVQWVSNGKDIMEEDLCTLGFDDDMLTLAKTFSSSASNFSQTYKWVTVVSIDSDVIGTSKVI
jgi:hypothetical protein